MAIDNARSHQAGGHIPTFITVVLASLIMDSVHVFYLSLHATNATERGGTLLNDSTSETHKLVSSFAPRKVQVHTLTRREQSVSSTTT
jgi:hypothetical protein